MSAEESAQDPVNSMAAVTGEKNANENATIVEDNSVAEQVEEQGGEQVEAEEEEIDDLFGDDDNEEDDGEDESILRKKRGVAESGDDDDEHNDHDDIARRRRGYMDEDEDEEHAMYTRKFYGDEDVNKYDEDENMHEFKEADVELVRHIVPYKILEQKNDNSKDDATSKNSTYYARIPPFLTIDPVPFDPPQFESEVKERLENTTNVKDRIGDRLIDENTIRWRYSRDANQTVFKESNAQIIQWSDGSYSLKLGDDYTDLLVNDISNTFLTVSHDQQELMQCVDGGEISKSAMFVPISTNSRLHQRLSKAIARRDQNSTESPRSMIINVDPEIEKKELEKKQSQIFRDRRKRKQREIETEQEALDSPGFSQGNYGSSSSRKRGQTPSYDPRRERADEYEEDDFIVDDEGEEDDDVEDDVEDEEDEDEEEEEEEEERNLERLKNSKTQNDFEVEEDSKRRKVAVIDDEDDE
ncbi:hypothetical protein TPHA_0E01730 [Tetrapisispora phaffii CBS 4417]|uniref:Leo1-like protein n=1 Tax=Tetrapisispora phaffii (strain ATCC 24235 / CBS 4417 / NBRC 1672 / NRRL Y-8282 / UCD 70-5) TaxID=1071381 RepID=G8BTN8_TETPH|nr:hypothetical protein TPHA_0E01730 [Tetrapisispora phaffii CBS 4417]CCE63266.1 hypothetical protein TPHA_0E01730 [Tetrapisispora phaffii CBS 4417]